MDLLILRSLGSSGLSLSLPLSLGIECVLYTYRKCRRLLFVCCVRARTTTTTKNGKNIINNIESTTTTAASAAVGQNKKQESMCGRQGSIWPRFQCHDHIIRLFCCFTTAVAVASLSVCTIIIIATLSRSSTRISYTTNPKTGG